jgi:hypothetical protein
MSPEYWKHIEDILKGMFGAACTAFALAALNYLGAHIPDLLQLVTMAVGGVAGVKNYS